MAGGHEQAGGENKAERRVRCLQVTFYAIITIITIVFVIIIIVDVIIVMATFAASLSWVK